MGIRIAMHHRLHIYSYLFFFWHTPASQMEIAQQSLVLVHG